MYRANTLLFLHRYLRKLYREPDIQIHTSLDENTKPTVTLGIKNASGFITQTDLEEANNRIPYFMDLSWIAAYVKNKKEFIVPALGITFTLPQYNGFNFVQMLSEYKSREQFISVLTHEMTHAGTVYLDTKRTFLETKAYAVGKGDLILGEYAVALNTSPPLLISILRWIFSAYLPLIPFPDKYFKLYPKIKSGLEILDNISTYRQVERELKELYGIKGGYILGRVNADEMEEFRDTNNIPARIAMKNDLKWKIMKTNLEKVIV